MWNKIKLVKKLNFSFSFFCGIIKMVMKMSIPIRQADGSMIRMSFNTDSLVKLDSITFNFDNYEKAKESLKKILNNKDKLFELSKKNFNKITSNSLFSAYYIINYDIDDSSADPIDFIKFSDCTLDKNEIEEKIDLQMYNNIAFMIANSNQFYSRFRNVWNKVIEIWEILAEDDFKILKRILNRKYSYNPKQIKEYVEYFSEYICEFFCEKIIEEMKYDTCYTSYENYCRLLKTSIPKRYYANLSDKFNKFIIKSLNTKIHELAESGYCRDIFDESFFGKEILELSDLNKKDLESSKDSIVEYYRACIEIRIQNKAYADAKRCFELFMNNKDLFDYKQIDIIKSFENDINNNYHKDPKVIQQKQRERIRKINDSLVPIGAFTILYGIISLIMCIVKSLNSSFWNYSVIISIAVIFIINIIDKKTR